jgi:hypothetical protein
MASVSSFLGPVVPVVPVAPTQIIALVLHEFDRYNPQDFNDA